MENMDKIMTVIATGVSLLGLLAFLRWPYRHYRVDRLRNEIFEVRAELFRLAASGALPFEHPAYGMLRQILNGFIRFGHTLSISGFVLITTDLGGSGRRQKRAAYFEEQWRAALSSLDCDSRQRVIQLEQRLHKAVAVHLLFSSPVFLITVLPALLLALMPVLTAAVMARLLVLLRPLLVRADSAALKVGDSDSIGIQTA